LRLKEANFGGGGLIEETFLKSKLSCKQPMPILHRLEQGVRRKKKLIKESQLFGKNYTKLYEI
jgi:hypothetical protein